MTYQSWIDQIIDKAHKAGDFEDINAYRGKAIDNSDYFNAPTEDRLCFHILKNQGFAPREVELNREINDLKRRIAECKHEKQKEELEGELAKKQDVYRIQLEHRGRKNPNSMGFRG